MPTFSLKAGISIIPRTFAAITGTSLPKWVNRAFFFIPEEVQREIEKEHDALKDWLSDKQFMVKEINDAVQNALKRIYAANPKHERLVDSKKNRSIADPWVIAHAMTENAIVVTKENKITQPNSSKIQIPNVCENMGIRWMDDFAFIREHNIKFVADKDE